ncbi:50S ribosomal protein L18 [Limisalsivibrio acetivorans]|uniref:50S ribosomal protein L18 n=1 Tax=Limisalsivibrio acetivorans TaxID=1304888 RepID=UPI0003B52A8D|nr:50S ribosomal protein L18 [Limisalsivibrio acetivorans]
MSRFDKRTAIRRKHARVRRKVSGTAARPRLAVNKSNSYIYAQVIDDETGTTLAAASSLEKDFKAKFKGILNKEAAQEVGKVLGERAKEKGVEAVVFDRGGYIYHGRVKALADAAREAGLDF